MKMFVIRCLPMCFLLLQGCAVIVCNTSDEPVVFKGEDGTADTVQPCECVQLTTVSPEDVTLIPEGWFQVTVCDGEGNEMEVADVTSASFNQDGETYVTWNGSTTFGFGLPFAPDLSDCEPPEYEPPMEEPPGEE